MTQMSEEKRETQPKNHNGVIGVLDDSRFGTALFTRLQLWTILGEDSELREWNPHFHFGRLRASHNVY
jgi:hypothetical protein